MTHKTAGAAQASYLYARFFEYERVVSKVAITADGVFKAEEVPEDYGGALLELEVVHSVRLTNSRNEFHILEFYVEEGMDKERKTGGPVERDGVEIYEQSGESAVPTKQTTKLNPRLTPEQQAQGALSKAAFTRDLGQVLSVPQQV